MEYADRKFIYEHCLFELKDDPSITNRVKDRDLLGVALCRLKENGFLNTCSRCGGTGEYSFNQMDGKRCFKCGGAKVILPRITKKWKDAVSAVDWRSKYTKRTG